MLAFFLAAAAVQFHVEIPQAIDSEQVFLEYCLYGDIPTCSWISPSPNRTVYTIGGGARVKYLKGILYAPGCAVETFTVELPELSHRFTCRPLPTLPLSGEIFTKDPSYGSRVELSATYAAPWAKRFFGTADALTNIPLGKPERLPENNRFQFAVPDFASDPLTASGSLYIWAKEKATGKLAALLVPEGAQKKIDSLKVQAHYPASLVFRPCPATPAPVHDKFGFAIRGEEHACVN